MSAHETTPGQNLSTRDLMSSTMFDPWIPLFAGAFNSLSMPGAFSSSTEPSHPLTHKKKLLDNIAFISKPIKNEKNSSDKK